MRDSVLDHIIMTRIPGFGVVSQNRLLKICGSIEACFDMPDEEILRMDDSCSENRTGARLGLFLTHRNDQALKEEAERIVRNCEQKNIMVITEKDPEYPVRFRGLPDMPPVLYLRGNLRINEFARSVGIVGARRCSAEGKQAAVQKAISELQKGSAVISGMAKGIDSYAQTAAVKNNGYTIAVLGSSPDICYPAEHERLYEEIIIHGCVLSENPPGTKPKKYSFPKRNRLIAALSDELYVIDTGRNSGTETTVEACVKYGRTWQDIEPR